MKYISSFKLFESDQFGKLCKEFDTDRALDIFKIIIGREASPTGGDCWAIALINFLEFNKQYPEMTIVGADGPHVLIAIPLNNPEQTTALIDGTGVYDWDDFRVRTTYKTFNGYLRTLRGTSTWIGDDQLKDINEILKYYKK